MNQLPRSYGIALLIFILTAGLTAFIGVSVTKMTGPAGTETELSSSSAEAVSSAPEETPSSSEETAEAAWEAAIRLLTEAELAKIEASCSDEQKTFVPGDALDTEGRPLGAVDAYRSLTAISENVRVFNALLPAADSVSFTFILNEENEEKTLKMLEILKAADISALFLTTQAYASENEDIIRAILADGHEIGSRGTGREAGGLTGLSLAEQMDDVLCFQNYMESSFGYTMKSFNYVSDVYTEQSVRLMTELGYRVIFFSVDYPEYDPAALIDTELFYNTMTAKMHAGAVYSFHTVNDASFEVVSRLIGWFSENSIRVISIE